MSKKVSSKEVLEKNKSKQAGSVKEEGVYPFWRQKGFSLLLICLGVLILYGWTLSFEYNLDDIYVTSQFNSIGNNLNGVLLIFKKMYVGLDYRPVPILTFWLERLLFGALSPSVSHAVNVLLFACLLMAMFRLIQLIRFYDDADKVYKLAFFTVLLFMVHTNHVSVVANIKSRDNLLSMLFGILSSIQFIRWYDQGKHLRIPLILLFFLLGLLSKLDAYAFIFLPVLTVLFYRPINKNIKKILLTLFIAFLIYEITFQIRYALLTNATQPLVKSIFMDASKTPLFNNDTFVNRLSMACVTMLYYLKFMLVPSGYYFYFGYDQIPLTPLFSPVNIVSVLLYLVIGAWCVWQFRKNRIYVFGLLFFLAAIFYASNLPEIVGGIVMDRYVFIASFGFCLMLSALLIDLPLAWKPGYWISAIVILFSIATFYRTSAWKDEQTLFERDIPHLEKSFVANKLVGGMYMSKANALAVDIAAGNSKADELAVKAFAYAQKANKIYDRSAENWQTVGVYYLYLKDYPKALESFMKCKDLDSNLLGPINYIGVTYQRMNKADSAEYYYRYVMQKETYYSYSAANLIDLLNNQNRYKELDSLVENLKQKYPEDIGLKNKLSQINVNKFPAFQY